MTHWYCVGHLLSTRISSNQQSEILISMSKNIPCVGKTEDRDGFIYLFVFLINLGGMVSEEGVNLEGL